MTKSTSKGFVAKVAEKIKEVVKVGATVLSPAPTRVLVPIPVRRPRYSQHKNGCEGWI